MNNLQLAVNHAIAVNASTQRTRAAYLQGGVNISGNTKRERLYQEFGYPTNINFDHLYNLYDRNSIAGAAVDRMTVGCWEDYPEIFEGDETQDADGMTDWDKNISKLFKKWFPAIKEADKRNLVGNYSAILVQFRDSQDWDRPVNTTIVKRLKDKAIVRLIPVWESQLDVSKWDQDLSSENYGYPKMYYYTSLPVGNDFSAPARQVHVHPDRIIILCEGAVDGLLTNGVPLLRKGFNDALDLEKISGGSAEGFLKNASRQLGFNFSKESDLNTIARMYGVEVDKLANAIDEQVRSLNNNTDSAVIMQDGSASVLSVAPADPQQSFNASLSKFAASIPIPVKILIGQITGERASTEDNKDWAKTRMSRRNGFLSSLIEDILTKFWTLGVIDRPTNEEITVSWSDLLAPSYAEKLENANKLADIATKTTTAFALSAIEPNEIRAAAELPTLPELEKDLIDNPTEREDPLNDDNGQAKKSDSIEK